MQQMNDWLDLKEQQNLNDLLDTEAKLISVIVSANFLIKAFEDLEQDNPFIDDYLKARIDLLKESISCFDEVKARRDERFKGLLIT